MKKSYRLELLTWDPVCQRSTSFAERLGQPLHTIHYLWYRRPLIAPIKYSAQFLATLHLLKKLQPDVTVVSNPPPFAALTALLFHSAHGGGIVVDAHTGVFLEPKWKMFRPLNKFLVRHSLMTIVTNEGLSDLVRKWGGEPFVLPDPLPRLDARGARFSFRPGQFNVAAIFSFYEDEPIDEVLAITKFPEDMDVWVTGDSRRVSGKTLARVSPRVKLTGFLDRRSYDALLQQADAAIVLCTRPHTMLCGAYEAAAQGLPLITSHSDAMEKVFRKGTIFVNNNTQDIERGLHQVRQRHGELARDMRQLSAELQGEWDIRFQQWQDEVKRRWTAAKLGRRKG
ncbi:MAG: glycosyltransferase [Myxococcales bacterium]|jgi:glycosyltransferase involved in cell wall biosynthesis|nr:glycosyltransferase [Myxococcales bacterium]